MDVVDDGLRDRLRAAFRWVDLGPHATHDVSDASGWWRDGGILADLGPALAALHAGPPPTVVLGPETSGFLLGPLVARALGVGFVEAYKGGLAGRVVRRATVPDHRGRTVTLSVREHLLTPADRVLVVDDWAATGAQLDALRSLVVEAGAEYLGAVVVVNCGVNGVRSLLSRHDLDAW